MTPSPACSGPSCLWRWGSPARTPASHTLRGASAQTLQPQHCPGRCCDDAANLATHTSAPGCRLGAELQINSAKLHSSAEQCSVQQCQRSQRKGEALRRARPVEFDTQAACYPAALSLPDSLSRNKHPLLFQLPRPPLCRYSHQSSRRHKRRCPPHQGSSHVPHCVILGRRCRRQHSLPYTPFRTSLACLPRSPLAFIALCAPHSVPTLPNPREREPTMHPTQNQLPWPVFLAPIGPASSSPFCLSRPVALVFPISRAVVRP